MLRRWQSRPVLGFARELARLRRADAIRPEIAAAFPAHDHQPMPVRSNDGSGARRRFKGQEPDCRWCLAQLIGAPRVLITLDRRAGPGTIQRPRMATLPT